MAPVVPLDHPGLTGPPPRPEPDRDRYGRYLIPDPLTGDKRSWIRATTWASTVADMHNLTQWQLRMAALGLSKRQDLLVGIAAVLDPESRDGKRKLDNLIEKAKEYARSSERATLGTALHSFCEAHDAGRPVEYIPPPFDADLKAYEKAMRSVKVSRNYIEQICLIPELGVAGTLDRVVAFHQGKLPMIGDVKSGRDLSYSWTEIAVQLALYSRASFIYDPAQKEHRPMLEVDQEKALVVHLPAGEARCNLYLIDIQEGWRMAAICGEVRKWRARKDLAQLLVSEEAK